MRIQSYLLLLLAFACGVGGSFFVASTFFWKKSNTANVVDNRPHTNVIVAKQDIPSGSRVDASMIRFQSAAIDEIPDKAIFSFSVLSGKKAIYNIPSGCPVCEEMLGEVIVRESEAKSFIPPGYRVVPIQVEKILGRGAHFTPGSHADIAVIPHRRSGTLIEKKNAVLGINTESGTRKTILEEVTVFAVRATVMEGAATENAASQVEEVSVLLTAAQLEELTRQSRLGVLRLSPSTSHAPPHLEAVAEKPRAVVEQQPTPVQATEVPTAPIIATTPAIPSSPVNSTIPVASVATVTSESMVSPQEAGIPVTPSVQSSQVAATVEPPHQAIIGVRFAESTVPYTLEQPTEVTPEPIRMNTSLSFVPPVTSTVATSAGETTAFRSRPAQELPAAPVVLQRSNFNPFNMGASPVPADVKTLSSDSHPK